MAFTELAEQIRALQRKVSELFTIAGTPAGVLQPFAGDTAPAGWLVCDGSTVERAEYAQLFAAIGTTYGAGDGSTTFELPDVRGRVLLGTGTGTAGDATAHALGQLGGAETHQLIPAEMPAHDHRQRFAANAIAAGGGAAVGGMTSGGGVGTYDAQQVTTIAGGDEPHNNLQPFLAVNYLIKT